MVQGLVKEPSARLLKHVIRCYLRLSDNPRCVGMCCVYVWICIFVCIYYELLICMYLLQLWMCMQNSGVYVIINWLVRYNCSWPCGPMDKASDYESGDSRFKSWQGHFLFSLRQLFLWTLNIYNCNNELHNYSLLCCQCLLGYSVCCIYAYSGFWGLWIAYLNIRSGFPLQPVTELESSDSEIDHCFIYVHM